MPKTASLGTKVALPKMWILGFPEIFTHYPFSSAQYRTAKQRPLLSRYHQFSN